MPRRNRVTPSGEIVATSLRGRWMGNRGVLHRGTGEDAVLVRPWANRRWIVCETTWKDWRAAQWVAGRYTVLFFHDEAVALAAGHRPCALCRRASFDAFRSAWASALGHDVPSASQLDAALHADRVLDGDAFGNRQRGRRERGVDGAAARRRVPERRWTALPGGTFVAHGDGAALVAGDRLVPWDAVDGYRVDAAVARPRRGIAVVLTPAGTVAALAAGYPVQIAPEATAAP